MLLKASPSLAFPLPLPVPSSHPLVLSDYVVYEPVLNGFFGTHYVVAVGVALNLLVGMPRVRRQDLIQAPLGADELFGVDLHVRRLSRKPPNARLVKEYPRVRQRVSLTLRPSSQEECP